MSYCTGNESGRASYGIPPSLFAQAETLTQAGVRVTGHVVLKDGRSVLWVNSQEQGIPIPNVPGFSYRTIQVCRRFTIVGDRSHPAIIAETVPVSVKVEDINVLMTAPQNRGGPCSPCGTTSTAAVVPAPVSAPVSSNEPAETFVEEVEEKKTPFPWWILLVVYIALQED